MDIKELKTIEHLKEKLKEIDANPFTEAVIKDNKIPFFHDMMMYRSLMPAQSDLMKAKDYEDETRIKLLRNKNSISRIELRKVLKENQNIDIEDLENKKQEVISQINEIYLSLARVNDLNTERIDELGNRIKILVDKFQDIGIEISNHMSFCIENKIEVAFIRYLTACCTEVQDTEGNWDKVWDSFLTFEKDKTNLPLKAEYWFSRLYLQTRE